jgi:primary-amine oxidase
MLTASFFLSLWFSAAFAQGTDEAQHPLDALTGAEVAKVVSILKYADLADDATRYPQIALAEPSKDHVLTWQPGRPMMRRAEVVYRKADETFEAVVDLDAGRIESQRAVPGAEPLILDEEWNFARDRFMADDRVKTALRRRGYDAANTTVFCTPASAGFFPGEGYEGRRILKVPCYDSNEKLHPSLARPIEGLLGVVDSETGEVLAVIDQQIVPLPPAPSSYGADLPKARAPLKPVEFLSELGPNIQVAGNLEVGWFDWSFHVRADKRAGIIISLVRFDDRGSKRLVAYRMNVSEMFVPYMDPDPGWNYRTFMDVGEFGLGYLISSLREGADCPSNALLADLSFPDDMGGMYTRSNAMCIFERPTGDPAWRHSTGSKDTPDSRPEVELVVRHIPTLGNYDYVIDYVFTQRGAIKLRVGATGFDAIKSVASASMKDATAAADTAHGALIAPYTVAPYHDHYINYRIDLDVDGATNQFIRDRIVPEPIDGSKTRKGLWRVKSELLSKEGPVIEDHSFSGGEVWRLANPQTTNALGHEPSYWLDAGHQVTSILPPDDPPQVRAAFSAHSLWLTQYKPDELWAAGNYPNLSKGGDGLPAYISDRQDLQSQDIVLWYTMGFRHLTKPEDFPILPTYWHEAVLRPAFFFDRDPSSTLNETFEAVPEEPQ